MFEHTNLFPICIPQFERGHAKRFNNTAAWVVGWADNEDYEKDHKEQQQGLINGSTKAQFYVNTRYAEQGDKKMRFYVETDGPGDKIGVCGLDLIIFP
jgi:hypothetical protein